MNYNPFSLKDKLLLITGASSGIGRTTAIECSRLGAKLIITGRDEGNLMQTFQSLEGEGHRHFIADLTNQEELEALVSFAEEIDGVVLCAGQGNVVPIKMADRKRTEKIFDINYFSQVELVRTLFRKKKLNVGCSLVFVASIGGLNSITIGNSIYGASKAALNSFMKFCAVEFAGKKIRANSVCPGMINTKMIKDGALSQKDHEEDMKKYPLKRYGEPEDIAFGIIYLLSDAASWVTGHSLVIDGGYTI